LARHIGVTPQRVGQYCARGLPVRADGKIDLAEALAWIKDNGRPQGAFQDRGVVRVSSRREVSDTRVVRRESPDYASGKARRENALADLAELKLATERGELLNAHDVRSTWLSILADIRARLLAIPARVTDLAQLDAEIRRALEELAAS
jgi:phage terminase Nu1 subunit (DNA packaging protein)